MPLPSLIALTFVALLAGLLLGWLLSRLRQSTLTQQIAVLTDRLQQTDASLGLLSQRERELQEARAASAAREAALNEQARQALGTADAASQQVQRLETELRTARDRAAQAETQVQIAGHARQALQQQLTELQSRHESLTQQHQGVADSERRLRAEYAALQSRFDGLREQIEQQKTWIEEQTRQLRTETENLTTRILEEKTQRFTALNSERIGELLNPLREQLGEFKQKVEQVYTDEAKERSALKAQVEQLHSLNKALSERTEDLTQALTTSGKAQGDWGEMILQRLFEESGLQAGREYKMQDSIESDEGARQRPDAVIYLPEERQLVVDSKVSLTAWTDYCAAHDDAAREAALKRHLASVRTHLRDLANRDYTRSPDLHTVDFVVMFVPIEAALLEALRGDDKLYAEAFRAKVVLVSPTTLFAVIKMVEGMWSARRREQNAEKIAEAGARLYRKLDGFVGSFMEIDKALTRAQKAFATARNQLHEGRGNVLRIAEEMRDLGLRTTGKSRITEIVDDQDALGPPDGDAGEDAQPGLFPPGGAV
jgi:DNA recombination protein RmuC